MPIIEKRKVYKVGSSMAITLPRGWLAYFEIECGDKVEVVANGELTIRPLKKQGDNVSRNAEQEG